MFPYPIPLWNGWSAHFDASIWIAYCFGPLQISKTSCSISRPTSTTIERIPHWKGERRIRRFHDHSQISAHFDGNLTVVTYIRHQWLRNFPKTLDRCVSGQPSGNLQLNHLVFAFLVAARFADPIVSLPPYQFARDMSKRPPPWRTATLRKSRRSRQPMMLLRNTDLPQQQIALHSALVLGILIASLGVRGLGNFADLDKLTDHPTQKYLFNVADVLLTGALVGGGSDFMHKLITTFTDLMDATSQKAKARRLRVAQVVQRCYNPTLLRNQVTVNDHKRDLRNTGSSALSGTVPFRIRPVVAPVPRQNSKHISNH